jgi:putative DNA primase/helicase
VNAPQLIPMPVDDPLPMAWLDTNDLGNAQRLVRLAKGLLLWVEEIGWVAYDAKRWSARDGERRASQIAHEVAYHIDKEAKALDAIAKDEKALVEAYGFPIPSDVAQERVTALRKHAVKSGDASRTAAMLVQARTLLAARREDFDQDPLAFNLQNGTLRFVAPSPDPSRAEKWRIRVDKHEPRDMIMQISAFSYEPKAECVEWKRRLELVQPEADQRRLLQAIFGYCLTGLTSEQKWFVWQGRGGDGKSLTNTVIADGMGDYYRHSDVKTWLKGAVKSGSDHSSDVARLAGDIRLVSFDEPPRNSTWNSSLLKQVTGGRITARGMREKEIEFVPRFKVIGEVNPLPAVESDDDGFWRRCRVLPWPYQFDKAGERAEPWDLVLARLEAELSGILNWMIEGALEWLAARRLPDAKASADAVAEYRQSASPFGEWLAERCDTSDPKAKTETGALYADFKAYCEKLGLEKAPTQTAFGRSLRDRQCKLWKDRIGTRFRLGIRLLPDGIGGGLGAPASPEGGAGGRAAQPLGPQGDDGDDWNRP